MKTDEEEISDQLGLSRNHGMVSGQGPEGRRSADPGAMPLLGFLELVASQALDQGFHCI